MTRAALATSPGAAADARRLDKVLARRSETSQRFFASKAGQWDRLRDELFGANFALGALMGLLPDTWVVGNLGCGTGATTAFLAPHVARVIGVDASAEMLAAAAARLGRCANVDLRKGTLEALPIDRASLDGAVMMLVLHHVPAPADALAEAARVVRPGGRLLLVDMAPHEHDEYRRQMGHVWLGFSEEHVRRLLTHAGFMDIRIQPLPSADAAKGPGLFVATARHD